jgi:hypothetical protein
LRFSINGFHSRQALNYPGWGSLVQKEFHFFILISKVMNYQGPIPRDVMENVLIPLLDYRTFTSLRRTCRWFFCLPKLQQYWEYQAKKYHCKEISMVGFIPKTEKRFRAFYRDAKRNLANKLFNYLCGPFNKMSGRPWLIIDDSCKIGIFCHAGSMIHVNRLNAFSLGFLQEKFSEEGAELNRFLTKKKQKITNNHGGHFFANERIERMLIDGTLKDVQNGVVRIEVRAVIDFIDKTWRRLLCECTDRPQCTGGGLEKIIQEEKLKRPMRTRSFE